MRLPIEKFLPLHPVNYFLKERISRSHVFTLFVFLLIGRPRNLKARVATLHRTKEKKRRDEPKIYLPRPDAKLPTETLEKLL